MATANNRKENTFKTKALPEAEPLEQQTIETEEKKPKKESSKKSEKSPKGKEVKPQKAKDKKESDGRITKIIGILFICLAVFLGLALISYLVSFFSGHHQEYGYQIFSKSIHIQNRTGSAGVFLAQTLIRDIAFLYRILYISRVVSNIIGSLQQKCKWMPAAVKAA